MRAKALSTAVSGHEPEPLGIVQWLSIIGMERQSPLTGTPPEVAWRRAHCRGRSTRSRQWRGVTGLSCPCSDQTTPVGFLPGKDRRRFSPIHRRREPSVDPGLRENRLHGLVVVSVLVLGLVGTDAVANVPFYRADTRIVESHTSIYVYRLAARVKTVW